MTRPLNDPVFARGAAGQPIPSAVINSMQEWLEYIATSVASPTIVDTGFTASTGWSLSSTHAVIQGGHVDLSCIVAYTGSSITVPASGNITDNPMLTVPAVLIPAMRAQTIVQNGVGEGAATLYGDADPSPGQVQLRTWTPSTTIAASAGFQFSFSYSLL